MRTAIVPLVLLCCGAAHAAQPVKLASTPTLSPDGKLLAFSWARNIWVVPSKGGRARQLTTAAALDYEPEFSPSGKQIAFTSDRTGSRQVFLVDVGGGSPRRLTFHTEGCSLQDWYPDGESLLINASRDHFWRNSQRFFQIPNKSRAGEQILFDAYGRTGQLSPDGSQLLFTREGMSWWWKGYQGARASQIWLFDIEKKEFRQLVKHDSESRSPLWKPDGKGFYYVSGQDGALNLWQHDLKSGKETQLTGFPDDSVIAPTISRDGSTIVFRHLFDLYRFRPGKDQRPQKLDIVVDSDMVRPPIQRLTQTSATDVSFSKDGLEVAFIAGGDLWVMDTELREPKQITNSPEEESDPVFSPDGASILYVSDAGGQTDIWRATRGDAETYWWQNDNFTLQQLTDDAEVESELKWSPAGDLVAFLKVRGDLWVMTPDGKEPRRVLKSWNDPNFDWSPDGKWLVYAQSNPNFNRDIYVTPIDGSREPFNLSRHPDNDGDPVWSPDGKVIAFTGRRVGDEVDLYFVYLTAEESEQTSRDRKIEKAIEKIKKVRKTKPAASKPTAKADQPASDKPAGQENESGKAAGNEDDEEEPDDEKKEEKKPADKKVQVKIDFDGIHDRIRRVSIPNSTEAGLFWSHDSKKLAFTATVDAKRGTYTIAPPDDLKPKLLSTQTGSSPRWIAQGNQIVWLAGGKPATLSANGTAKSYAFSVRQEVNTAAKYKAGFDQCWRAMRDYWYDENMNNRNWDAIRRKYASAARESVDGESFARVVSLMLGELNGSHLGFGLSKRSTTPSQDQWRETTAHLGLRFDASHRGPGLLVRDVILRGPADKVKSKIAVGETVLSIDGTAVDPAMDRTGILNGRLDRDVTLKVRSRAGDDRDVTIRPISFSAARSLLYEQWVRRNQAAVEESSKGKLGYLHIRGMNMSSFYRFERELFAVAAGKDGIVIDVRDNGGGFTTDHLLTVLTQPVHAITVPRGGEPGYPHDRKVYASWTKPIVVLCNQNSFSNAEIFSHAIKTLKRGQLVGVPTAGGVISTGATRIMDLGTLRMPFRGWYLLGNGQDMERNGAEPDHVLWPQPGELPSGQDRQLEKAIAVLRTDVAKWKKRPQPEAAAGQPARPVRRA